MHEKSIQKERKCMTARDRRWGEGWGGWRMTASGWGLLFMGMKCAGIRQWGRAARLCKNTNHHWVVYTLKGEFHGTWVIAPQRCDLKIKKQINYVWSPGRSAARMVPWTPQNLVWGWRLSQVGTTTKTFQECMMKWGHAKKWSSQSRDWPVEVFHEGLERDLKSQSVPRQKPWAQMNS